MIDPEPTKLAPAAWHASRDAIQRSLVALNELAKLESGTERARVEIARDRMRALDKQYAADAGRIAGLERSRS